MKKYIFVVLIIFVFSCSGMLYAQQIEISTTVNTQVLHLGHSFQFIIDVIGESDVEIPNIESEDFIFDYQGSCYISGYTNERKMSIDNHLMYLVTPLKSGKLAIPSIKLMVKGRSFLTEPVDIEVNEGLELEQFKNKVFAEIFVDETKIYSNEEIEFEIKLYLSKEIDYKDIQIIDSSSSTYLSKPFKKADFVNEEVNGELYTVIPFKTVIQPVVSGNLIIGPLFLEVNVRNKPKTSDELLNSLINDGYNFQTIIVSTEDKQIQVLNFTE